MVIDFSTLNSLEATRPTMTINTTRPSIPNRMYFKTFMIVILVLVVRFAIINLEDY